uniref:F-box domain-containing protein n=2 Tax=Clastoptera arizonana TaxID=38151 RepID=A0A1B6C3M3_9HEMI
MSENKLADVNSTKNETNKTETFIVEESTLPTETYPVLVLHESSNDDGPIALSILMKSAVNYSRHDVVVVLLYILTVETGFTPLHLYPLPFNPSQHFDIRRMRLLKKMPSEWKRESYYKLEFVVHNCSNSNCYLICKPIGNHLSVTMFYKEKAFSMIFNPSRFINDNPLFRFKDLCCLSNKFKNTVVLPLRSCILNDFGLQDGLLSLPVELIITLSCYLNKRNLNSFTCTCKYFYSLR